MKEKKWLFHIAIPVAFTVVMCVLFLPAVYPAVRAAAAQWRAAWIMGAPEYIWQASAVYPSGQAEEGSIKHPSVGTQYGELYCEKLDGKIPLYYGDGEELLELGAGTYTGYGIPGEGQRVLIGAHDTTYFAGLDKLEAGDRITLATVYGSYTYQVTETRIADVAAPLPEASEEGAQELILYTCYPLGEADSLRTERYLVYCIEMAQ